MTTGGTPGLPGVLTAAEVDRTVASIVAVQLPSGAVPWFEGGQLDPWDHVEAAMALDVGGRAAEAEAAYRWLCDEQRPGGWWPSVYHDGVADEQVAETHHSAYLAVGCWHHYLATGDDRFLAEVWPTVRAATDFVLRQQGATGVVGWAARAGVQPDPVALVTGSSSTYQGLRCAIALAEQRGCDQPDWELAAAELGAALRDPAGRFADKDRYSMDWYYPVLGGAVRGPEAIARLDARWDEFVVPGFGIRCVSDRPWATGAETCELALALEAVGDHARATSLVADMQHLRDEDGSYWTGLVHDEGVRWPEERTTWTAAAVVLAVDALDGRHPRSGIFRDDPTTRVDRPGSGLTQQAGRPVAVRAAEQA